jgi:dihydrofolate reductase
VPVGRTQYYLAASLDGYLAEADGGLDWLLSFGLEGSDYDEFIADVGAIAMGAATYEWVVANQTAEWSYDVPTWVFTHRRLPHVDGADVRFAHGPVAGVHPQLAEAAGERNVWVCGGGDLAAQYVRAGLLDQILLTIAPVLLGAGIPFLPVRLVDGLELVGTRSFPNGMAQLDYRVAADSRRLSQ